MLGLSPLEARVLGSLIEKSQTTPDYYPMTINAVTSACNQSSNRDPVTDYTESQVEEALRSLREGGLVRSVRTAKSRVMKHQHDVEKVLVVGRPASALLAVLLLRGGQTTGELRTRTERYHAFADLDEVEDLLTTMAQDDPPLVRQLARQPGQKEARWIELLSDGEDLPEAAPASAPAVASTTVEQRVSELEVRVAALEQLLERHADAPLE